MKTCLIFPPNFTVDQPYLAIPALVAYLRQSGLESIHHIDTNIDSFNFFSSKDFLQRCLDKIEDRMKNIAWAPDESEYQHLLNAQITFRPVVENIEAAHQYFRTVQKTTITEYYFYSKIIAKSFDIVSAAYFPTEITIRDFIMRFSCQNSPEILQAAESDENPYIDFFKEDTLPKIRKISPQLIGVSVACMSQIIPSFTLAKLVRDNFPDIKIVFGGQVFNRLIDHIRRVPSLFEYVDYFVDHEGETALLKLIRYLEGQGNLEEVPNLTYFDENMQTPKSNGILHIERMEDLPVPDFSDLDLTKYLSPKAILPYQPVRGCYWHRCTFCNHFAIHPPEVRKKNPEQFVKEMTTLIERYGASGFTIVNEGLEPYLLNEYAKAIIKANLDTKWYVGGRLDARIDRETLDNLKNSGCKKVYFGLESGSQKVLNAMHKGITLRHARRILSDCGDLGLAVHLFIMLGFPTETFEELETSKPFLYECAKLIPREGFTFYISVFQLKPCTCVFEIPREFKIKSISMQEVEQDLEYLYDFELEEEYQSNIDYEKQLKEIEENLDVIQGPLLFPENVVHYLSMRENIIEPTTNEAFREPDSIKNAKDSFFCVRPGLGFAKKGHSSEQSGVLYLAYDLVHDSFFEIRSAAAWDVMNTLSGLFKFDKLVTTIEIRLAAETQGNITAKEMAFQLVYSRLVVPATTIH